MIFQRTNSSFHLFVRRTAECPTHAEKSDTRLNKIEKGSWFIDVARSWQTYI